jgi:outer membrane lipoprotein-sorting protein
MQTDGNFVIYAGSNVKWTSNSAGTGGDHLTVQNDGNLVIYNANNTQGVWATNTPQANQSC